MGSVGESYRQRRLSSQELIMTEAKRMAMFREVSKTISKITTKYGVEKQKAIQANNFAVLAFIRVFPYGEK